MTSKAENNEAFVWVWLPGSTEPVVAGRLERSGSQLIFNYGRSYLGRNNAISLYEPELPLQAGALPLPAGLSMPSSLRDAAPDAWGRRVIINRQLGRKGNEIDPADLDELTYLLESGSDRIGALDFQRSATKYVARQAATASLALLANAARHVEEGVPLPADLDAALLHGSSIGGARPKATIEEDDSKYIVKFSSQSDVYNVVKAEFIAMRLAALTGINAAPVRMEKAGTKDVLLIRRFDRDKAAGGWHRRAMVSALTLQGLDEMMARYASYEELASIIRHRFDAPKETLRELYARLVFNILCGNTDDHARNHAAFWNGQRLVLTPAYDICPQARNGSEATQAMLVVGEQRVSQVALCIEAAPVFLLSAGDAEAIAARQIITIRDQWDATCTEARLSPIDKKLFWRRQFLNPYAFEGAPAALRALVE
ncbi:type II toxin-antitoxin system HipA family toxin [Rhizobium ruizarguesonis]|jgi:serine/threonine-protein kinase HipA|uniref:type II toxin-antitoxin system HipA family toxin n=1 Tax=Rhizobium ruizarguesonis TaxID=2081791 RepID=UPI001031D896|nr:HipA domain-containing protein [Rhizobium ruizarguesonis]MBY5842342.1 type II toxin-antitoxin system HipA family toxin [Rhizobium leguminosarum]TBY94972.1 type II toxin-antitoxin system HipA family toxin [Rhizobium leguminosarum bv. viciae]NEH83357.1 type II toxin-antitoxin system HipA family toxin [Rhizobium ruizarguesonis]NEI15264.1 type II toxin-antitoxin system HipA family toxin [Rhizobium ruizarguesonis]NEJ56363.1 type II toxin-antitoxin system HipA family toxin [Rhizobium ruizargueson